MYIQTCIHEDSHDRRLGSVYLGVFFLPLAINNKVYVNKIPSERYSGK